MSFDPPAVRVDEDVPSGFVVVCLRGDASSASPYVVEVADSASGNNPATGKMMSYTMMQLVSDRNVSLILFSVQTDR